MRIRPSGPPEVVADFLKFAANGKPLAYFQTAGIEANPYAMVPDPANRRFFVTDGASGQVLVAGLDGKIDVFTPEGDHAVLTGITDQPGL